MPQDRVRIRGRSLACNDMPKPQKEARPTVWEDPITGKCHIVNNETGAHLRCDRTGTKLIAPYISGLSGVASTHERKARIAEVHHSTACTALRLHYMCHADSGGSHGYASRSRW